jgi:serine/threonine protein kinase
MVINAYGMNLNRTVKLADFGASALIKSSSDDSTKKELQGTPYYMAPEVLMQLGHDFKADIWSGKE